MSRESGVDSGEVANKGGDTPGFHYIAERSELSPGDRIIVDVRGREVAVYNIGGEYRAMANYCPHQGGPVCEGALTGTVCVSDEDELEFDRDKGVARCPWHGWGFDIETGEHLSKSGYCIPTYETVMRDQKIYVKTR